MAILKGLSALNKLIDENDRSEDRPKARWLKLASNQSVTIQFLQEIDEASPEYNEKAGTLLVAEEHTSPTDWKKKCLCTRASEGQCVGCERAREYPKTGWRAKTRLYVNVLVDDGVEKPYVAILSQSTSNQSITPALLSFANEYGSITNIAFKITRRGVGTDTGYSIMPKMNSTGANIEDLELFDLERCCTYNVNYADQTNFFGPVVDKKEEEHQDAGPAPDTSTIEW